MTKCLSETAKDEKPMRQTVLLGDLIRRLASGPPVCPRSGETNICALWAERIGAHATNQTYRQ